MPDSLTKLRQIDLAVADDHTAADALAELLNISTAWEYEWQGEVHLRALRAGDTFIEFLSPMLPTVRLGRFLKHQGEGFYLLVGQTTRDRDEFVNDLLRRREVLSGIWEDDQYRLLWLYPKTLNGVLLEIGEVLSEENPWTGGHGDPERENWYRVPAQGDLKQIRHGVVVVRSLEAAVAKWTSMFDVKPVWHDRTDEMARTLVAMADGDTFLEFRQPAGADLEETRFLREHGEGLFSMLLEATDLDAIERRARDLRAVTPLTGGYPMLEGFAIDPRVTAGARFEIARGTAGADWPVSEWSGAMR